MNDNGQDYSNAKEYGELFTVTHGMQPIFKIHKLKDAIEGTLQYYKEDDHLLISGPTLISLLGMIYLFEKFDAVNLLIHDARNNKYVDRTIYKDMFKRDSFEGVQ